VIATHYPNDDETGDTSHVQEILNVMQDAARALIQDRVDEREPRGLAWLMGVLGVKSSNAAKYLLDGWRWRKRPGEAESVKEVVPVEFRHLAAIAHEEQKRASQILQELLIRVKALEAERRAMKRDRDEVSAPPLVAENQDEDI
jgi:hypothetical protein